MEMSVPLDDGIVIITAASNLIRALAVGSAALVIGCAAIGLRAASREANDDRSDRVHPDRS
jgi:hypothetical protein